MVVVMVEVEKDDEALVQTIYDSIIESFFTPVMCYVFTNKMIEDKLERDKTIVYTGIIIGMYAGLLSAFLIQLMNSISDSTTIAVLGIFTLVNFIVLYSLPYISKRYRHYIAMRVATNSPAEANEIIKKRITKEQEEQMKDKIREAIKEIKTAKQ